MKITKGLVLQLLLLFSLLSTSCFASITLPSWYSDNMIIQRQANVCVNGHTTLTNSKVSLTMVNTFFHIFQSAMADDNGNFQICFTSPDASTQGFSIQISAASQDQQKETISFNNALFGDVFLCSGQSNMQMTVDLAFNATSEIQGANYDTLRMFTVKQNASATPLTSLGHFLSTGWNSATPSTVGGPSWQYTSATCYFFGREIYLSLNRKVPVGLFISSYGGTRVEAWSSPDAVKKCPANPPAKDEKNQPTVLWNAMINPILDMRFKAVAWYQGESNSINPPNYACQFPAMIQDWREKFNLPNVPFYFVQLAGYQPGGNTYADLRLYQEAALKLPSTAMAVAVDLGDPNSPSGAIHPRNKQQVGFRLSYYARSMLYNQQLIYEGPILSSAIPRQSNDQFNATLLFNNQGELAVYLNGTESCTECCGPTGLQNAFEVELASGKWIAVDKVVFPSGNTVYVYATATEKVVGMRYAYSGYPQCMLYNEAKLPSPPFKISFQ